MEIILALFDFIPVALCFIAMIILQKCLYNHTSKYEFALLASGSIMILTAGVLKALWKLLYYGFNIDLYRLDFLFFPIQSIGFILVFLGLLFMLTIKHKETKTLSLIPLVSVIADEGKKICNEIMLYVVLQILGCAGFYGCIITIAKRMKKPVVIALIVFAFIMMLLMGFLSTKISGSTGNDYILYNWLAEIVNTLGQGSLLAGVIILDKNKLKEYDFTK